MTHVRTIARTALALAFLSGTAALAQTSTATSTVAASNTLTLTAGSTISLSPSAAGNLDPVSNSDTVLTFATNDGFTYKISVVASTWVFGVSGGAASTSTWPELKFVSATSGASGTASGTAATLLTSGNVVSAAAPVLAGITSVADTVTVTISAAYVQAVVAGLYTTTLTYTLATP